MAKRALTLNRPERLNSFNAGEMHAGVRERARVASPGDGARAMLCESLTGAGRALLREARTSAIRQVAPGGARRPRRIESSATLSAAYRASAAGLPVPTIAAVNGASPPAQARTLALAACDLVVAATVRVPSSESFGRLGLVPDSGATLVHRRLVGAARAR